MAAPILPLHWKALALASTAVAAAPAFGLVSASIEALTKLERGRWQIIDDSRERRPSLCLGDPMQLARLEHRRGKCTQEIISADEAGGTVQYSCPSGGFGHSTVRVETPRIVRIDTQGLVDGRPFAYRAEARRVGDC
jgi:hypothetical protein